MSENNFISPLLEESVNEKKYTDKIHQKSEILELDVDKMQSKTEKTVEKTVEKPIEKPDEERNKTALPDDLDEKTKRQLEQRKSTFVQDDDDGVESYNIKKDTEEGQDATETEENQQANVEITPQMSKVFGKVIINGIKKYLPLIFVKNAQLNPKKINQILLRYSDKFSNADAQTIKKSFKENNDLVKEKIRIEDDEAELLTEAFTLWLEYKNIQASNPQNALIAQSGMILLRLSIDSAVLKNEMADNFKNLMKHKFDIELNKN